MEIGNVNTEELRAQLGEIIPQEPSECQHNMVSYTDSATMRPEHFCSVCGHEPAPPIDREKLAEQEAEEYAPGDHEAQDDFLTGWRAADQNPAPLDPEKVAEARAERDAALEAIERARELHQAREDGWCSACAETNYQTGEFQDFPCPTIQALDGAPEPEEVEWEYGRMYFDEAGDFHIRETTDVTSPDGHRADGSPYWNYRPMRRRKAGPWEPLPVGGEKR